MVFANDDGLPRTIDVRDATNSLAGQLGAIHAALSEHGRQLSSLLELIQRCFAPLAEQNAALRNRDIDQHVIAPLAETVIEMLDDIQSESCERDGAFGVLAECRDADRERLLQLLRRYDIHEYMPGRGTRFDVSRHTGVRAETRRRERVGLIRAVIRPGYIRRRDNWVVRAARVEVYVPAHEVAR